MQPPDSELDIILRAGALDAGIMRSALRRFLEVVNVDERSIAFCEIAVGEALCNAVEHAYGRDAYGTMRLRAAIRDGKLYAEVCDNGHWRPEPVVDGGRGFLIMGVFAKSVDIARSRDGTTVRLVFEFQPSSARLPHAPTG